MQEHREERSIAGRALVRLASPASASILAAIVALLSAAALPLEAIAHQPVRQAIGWLPLFVAFGAVGLIIARTQPRHVMGWILLGIALAISLSDDAGLYAIIDYRLHDGSLPLGFVAVLLQPGWAPTIVLAGLAVLLFPDGKLPGTRLRWLVLAFLGIGLVWMLGAYGVATIAILQHNIHIERSGDLVALDHPRGGAAWWGETQDVFFPLLFVSWLAWLVSQIPGYLRSTGERRLQLKWLLSGATIFVASGVATFTLGKSGNPVVHAVGASALIGFSALPIAIGVGITRFRLYEIDRLISRTISYGILSAALAGTFVAIIGLTTRVLPFSSPIAVAASTLCAVLLFNPLRRRVQRIVDRRFNRARYHAEDTVSELRARLRDAVDLETTERELVRVVQRAFEPSHVTVWVRSER